MNGSILVILLTVVFTAAVAIGQSLYLAYLVKLDHERKELTRRLGMLGGDSSDQLQSVFREQAIDQAGKALGGLGNYIQDLIKAADRDSTVSKVLYQMAGTGIVIAIIAAIFINLPAGLFMGFIGSYLPFMLLKRAGKKRAEMLVLQLPDALDLIARSLQAGASLNDAYKLVAEELPMPVAGEFGRVFEEVGFGRDFRVAMLMMQDRNPTVFDLRLFVSSVLLVRETGGNLIEILLNISNTIRGRFLFAEKVKGMTAEARTSGYILGGLPLGISLMISTSNPKYLTPLIESTLGNMLLGACVVSYCLGVFFMGEASKVEV